jgi:putative transposase
MGVGEIRRLKQLEEENSSVDGLKQLVADLSLDKLMLQEVLSRKV